MKVDRSLGLLGVLLEPTTGVAKAWEQVAAVGQRAFWEPRTVLVTGAGPIGLLAALLGTQRGLAVHVLDRVETGAKPDLVRDLGATYHAGSAADVGFQPDIVIECTGVGAVIGDAVKVVSAGGVVCLTGVGSGGRVSALPVADAAAEVVLRNNVVVGSVNANKRHWYKAGQALARADRAWLAIFAVDGSGKLSPAGWVPTGGRMPRSSAIDPTGRWLIAANQGSSSVVVFRLDPETGLPRAVGTPIELPEPASVLFSPSHRTGTPRELPR